MKTVAISADVAVNVQATFEDSIARGSMSHSVLHDEMGHILFSWQRFCVEVLLLSHEMHCMHKYFG
jgi:hypothetical protein